MRLVSANELRPGMKIARNIYGSDSRLLLGAGVTLTPELIKRIHDLGISSIYIKDEFVGEIEIQDIISEKLKARSLTVVRQCFEKARVEPKIDLRQITTLVSSILDEVLSFSNLLVSMIDIRSKDSHFFSHSVSVCTLALLTGIAMGYDQLKLHQLGIGALLHDIGKSRLDKELLNSPATSPQHIAKIQAHTAEGFEILRKIPEISILSAHVPFQHHERYDGAGYPRGLSQNEIHPYAAITAVANAFDLLISPPQGQGMFPAKALEIILLERGKAFDPEIALAFARQISPYPTGCTIRLNSGELAVVLYASKKYPTRPVVKIITDRHGKVLQESFPEVDLSQHPEVKIISVLSEAERNQLIS